MTNARTQTPRHGGDPEHAARLYGAPADGWVDLSTGVNPWPYPVPNDIAAAFARFPTAGDLARLDEAARRGYGVPDPVAIVPAAGSELLIRQLPRIVESTVVALAAPAYRSHGEAWRAAGHSVTDWDRRSAPPADARVLVIANPNNPDGATIQPSQLLTHTGESRLLVVDEAFAELDPDCSLVPNLAGRPAIVLRSFGKFFGLPGLRLGFAVGSPGLAGALAECLGDWPVSTPAAVLAAQALTDTDWQAQTRTRLAETASRLRDLLTVSGLPPVGGTNLFQLIAPVDAPGLHRQLARRGVLTRLFPETGHIRIGLPGSETAWERLITALRAVDLG